MAQNLIQAQGGQPQKPTHFVSLFTSRFLTGYYSNRSLLRGPLSFIYSDFYHAGATDALCDGLNSELSIRQTLTRRPGNPVWCSVKTNSAIDNFYSFHQSNGTIQVIADSVTDVYVASPSTLTSIFTKNATAGEATFVGINTSLYIADGTDLVKYTPGINNPVTGKPIWNWGGAAPTIAPTLKITSTGSAGVNWVASTMWTTMGLLVDSNGNVQQITSVNSSGTNTTQLGTTGNGNPPFSSTPGVTTSDNTITWTNLGPIVAWSNGLTIQNISAAGGAGPVAVYDPTSNSIYVNIDPGLGTGVTGSTKPTFTGVFGSVLNDGTVKWLCLGTIKAGAAWKGGHSYPTLGSVSNDYSVSTIVTPISCAAAGIGTGGTTAVYLQGSSGGTSGASGAAPIWSTVPGQSTGPDGDLYWNCLGTATRQNNTNYYPWGPSVSYFSVIKDGSGNLQVCISATGPSNSSGAPTFASVYGQQTQDGINPGTQSFVGVTWSCVGTSLSWAASTKWYLPVGGFVPPQPSQNYGGATLSEAGVNQYVINSGKSQTPGPPSWGALLANTTDGGVTWYAASSFTSAGFSWTKGMGYVYSYFARTATDVDVTTAPPLQIPGTNSPNITGPLGPPTGCADGSITTSSPVAQITGGNTGAQVLITVVGSTDPQFDTIRIYRSTDGFGAAGPYLFLTDIPMPPVINGTPGTAQIIDFMPDLATALLPGLDVLIEAPVDNENDPPPGQYGSTQFIQQDAAHPTIAKYGTTLQGPVPHQGRIWGFIGNSVFASGGPDTVPGNGFTAFPPINEFPFDSPITKLQPTASALIVFTTTDVYIIAGGPAITDYYSQLLVGGVGLVSTNAMTMMLGLPYLFTSDRQFITVDPSGGFTRIGHPIGDKLSLYDAGSVYVTYHSYGDQEHCLFVSNGNGEWYRCDPNPTPDSQLTGPIWSPKAVVSGNYKAIKSIETSPGVRQLLIGPTAAGYILARDSSFTIFQDNCSTVNSSFTVLASDNFTRANENPLSDGGKWTVSGTGWDGTPSSLQVLSNYCSPTATATPCINFFTGISWPNDQYVQATIQTLTSSNFITLYVRANDSYTQSYQLDLQGGTSVRLYKNYNAAYNLLLTIPIIPVATDIWKLAAQGSTLTVYKNGTIVGTVADSSIYAGTPGLGAVSNTTHVYDVQVSNWVAGSLAYTDGVPYESYFTMGNIVLAHAGQMAECGFIEADFIQTGSQPRVSILLDELGPTNGAVFESISNIFVSDPPKQYGPTGTPKTMWMNRYYFGQTTPGNGGDQTPMSAWCKSMQIKVDFGNTDTVQNEMIAFTIFGALYQEK